MRFLRITYESPYYQAALALRQDVLRAPLGMSLRDSDIAGEESQLHFIALQDEQLVGTVTFKPLSDTTIKLRQMAIAPSVQGQGVGQQLVAFAEQALAALGYQEIETYARVVALRFYERMGYQVTSEPFEEVGLPHVTMQKMLKPLA